MFFIYRCGEVEMMRAEGLRKQMLIAGMTSLVLFFLIVFTGGSFAENRISVMINGEQLDLYSGPIMEGGRVLLPLRAVSENFEYQVSWDSRKKMVSIKDSKDILEIPVGTFTYKRNGKEKKMDVAPKLRAGTVFVPIRMVAQEFGCKVDWDVQKKIVWIEKYRTVEAPDAVSLLKNIGKNTKIILTGKEYNLSNVVGISNPHVKKTDVFDGEEYMISGVENLTIESKKGVKPLIVVKPRYANVLTFEGCYNIRLEGITAGHTAEPGYCTGGVIAFKDTEKADLVNCKLYGCGTYGVTGERSSFLNVSDSEIYDCTYGCVEFYDCRDVFFSYCMFRDSKEFNMFHFSNSARITIKDSEIKNNETIQGWSFLSSSGSDAIEFLRCRFTGNKYSILQSGDEIKLKECYIAD